MKVLVLSGATYGDPARRRVFDRIAERGVEIVLALPRLLKYTFLPGNETPDTPWPTPGVRLVKMDAWHVHSNDTHRVLKGLPGLIRECAPDIVHCAMEPWSLTCIEALAVLPTLRKRPLFGVHPCETKPEQGTFPVRAIRQFLYRRALSRCDFFMAWSTPVMRCAERLGLNGQVRFIAPGVGVQVSESQSYPAGVRHRTRSRLQMGDPEDFLVGFVGRFVEEKGVLDLLAAMDDVVMRRRNVGLVLAGAGPLQHLLESARSSRPWLRLVGGLDRAGIASLMGALDIFVLPSRTTPRWEEQFGLVLTEAMAAGVPVIGSTCGAIPEVVGDAGWIIEEGNPRAIRDCIERAMDDRVDLSVRGTRARARAISKFSDEAVAEALVRTWQAALERRR